MVSEGWIEKQKIRFDCMGTHHFNVGRGRPLSDAGAAVIVWGPNQTAIYTCEQDEYDVVPLVDDLADYGITVKNVDYQILCPQIRDCCCP